MTEKTTKFKFQQFSELGDAPKEGKGTARLLTAEFVNDNSTLIKQEAVNVPQTLPGYWQHAKTEYILDWTNLRMEGPELLGDYNIFQETQRGREAIAMAESGKVWGVSIGGVGECYPTVINNQKVTVVTDLKLEEASLVVSPADKTAGVLIMQSLDNDQEDILTTSTEFDDKLEAAKQAEEEKSSQVALEQSKQVEEKEKPETKSQFKAISQEEAKEQEDRFNRALENVKQSISDTVKDEIKVAMATTGISQAQSDEPQSRYKFYDDPEEDGSRICRVPFSLRQTQDWHTVGRGQMVIEQAVNTNDASAGANEPSVGSFVALAESNPFAPHVRPIPANGAKWHAAQFGAGGFQAEPTYDDTEPHGGRPDNTSNVARSGTIQNFTLESALPRATVMDVPGIRNSVMFEYEQQAAVSHATTIAATIKAAVRATTAGRNFSEVRSGASAALPASGNAAVQKVDDVIAEVDPQYYAGAVIFMSVPYYKLLRQAASASSPLYFDPERRIMTFDGFPVIRTSYLDSTAAANTLHVVFGSLNYGLWFAEREGLDILESVHANLGKVTWLGTLRYDVAVRDANAVAGLTVGT